MEILKNLWIFKKTFIYACDAVSNTEAVYLVRYTLIERLSWQLCLHVFHLSDDAVLHAHRIHLFYKNRKAITLVLMFKRRRNWGFFTNTGWMERRRYVSFKNCC